LRFASVPPQKNLWLLDNGKSRSLRADARRTNTLSFKTQVMQQGAGSKLFKPTCLSSLLSLSEFLSKIGTHLLASSDIMEKNRNPLACLKNAGPYFVESYCTRIFFNFFEHLLLHFEKLLNVNTCLCPLLIPIVHTLPLRNVYPNRWQSSTALPRRHVTLPCTLAVHPESQKWPFGRVTISPAGPGGGGTGRANAHSDHSHTQHDQCVDSLPMTNFFITKL
jgi:hypothetical protein